MENHTHTSAGNNSTRDSETIGAERITNESLKQSAQELLENYYNERDSLIGQIVTFEECLSSARDDLKALNKKNRNLLKQTGGYKTQEEKVFNLIKNNPGLTNLEIRNLTKTADELLHLELYAIPAVLSRLCERGIMEKREGRFFTVGEFKIISRTGFKKVIVDLLKSGPLTKREIKERMESDASCVVTYDSTQAGTIMHELMAAGKISSDQTYKGQNNATYTWIGD